VRALHALLVALVAARQVQADHPLQRTAVRRGVRLDYVPDGRHEVLSRLALEDYVAFNVFEGILAAVLDVVVPLQR
jgi:hypothetical protein